MLLLLLFCFRAKGYFSQSELGGETRVAHLRNGVDQCKPTGERSWGQGPSRAFFPSLPNGISFLFEMWSHQAVMAVADPELLCSPDPPASASCAPTLSPPLLFLV